MTAEIVNLPKVGDKLGQYSVERVENLPAISGTLLLLRHSNGARHAHIFRQDDNLAFAVAFPTVPKDSTGVAHILEHNVLMGSQKYPVPDPFFAMLPRSLNTFMNAMTSSDCTTYPFSTRNPQDYKNLLGIYLDAAFFPLLRRESFLQDGHRFEFEQIDDPSTPLKLQGVVYNEMKGAMASAGSIMWRSLGKALYPDLTYAHNSGGSPNKIPELSYEALKAFHAAHYHPSNAYFYSYGNQNLEPILEIIEREVMSKFSPQELDVSIPDQANFDSPRQLEVAYPSSDKELGSQVLISWKLGYSSDPDLSLRWHVLNDILLGNPAAPLMHALIESGVGSALADLSGYESYTRESAFSVGLKGLGLNKTQTVQDLVLELIKKIATDGIEPELIESSLHQFEIGQKEVSNSGTPYGLKLMSEVIDTWIYGGDPVTGLDINEQLSKLKLDLENGKVFEPMLEKLLNNTHRVTLTLTPDPEMAERMDQVEKELIESLSKDFTEDDKQRIIQDSLALSTAQDEKVDYSVLPTLKLSDIPLEVAKPSYTSQKLGRATIGRVSQPTGGISYLDLQVRMPAVPNELIDILPLYTSFLTQSGAAGQDYVALARRIEAKTGGISAGVGTGSSPNELTLSRLVLSIGGKALARNATELVNILHDVAFKPEFEHERLKQLLKQRLARMKSSIISNGSSYSSSLAAAQISSSGYINERIGGLSSFYTLSSIVDGDNSSSFDERIDTLLGKFKQITQLIPLGTPLICLTAMPEDTTLELSSIANAFTGNEPVGRPPNELPTQAPQARITDSPVSFNAMAFSTVPYAHPDSPALLVLSRLLRSEYLLKEIREKGGAYGGSASFDASEGVFSLSSYRDPHIKRTFEVFMKVDEFLQREFDERHLHESILSASKLLDPLTSPSTVGRMRFFGDNAGYTPAVQEEYKARLLKVSLDDIRRAASLYLGQSGAAYAVVSGKNPNEETKELGLEFEVKNILP